MTFLSYGLMEPGPAGRSWRTPRWPDSGTTGRRLGRRPHLHRPHHLVAPGALASVLLCAEILRIPAQDAVMPELFGRENAHGSPAAALWLTNGCIQVVLILTLFASSTYLGWCYWPPR